jgi:hypothetical protein
MIGKTFTEQLMALGHGAALGITYFEATKQRYGRHVEACHNLERPGLIEPFEVFAYEIVNAVNDKVRDSILKDEPLGEAPPAHQSYGQYVSPYDAGSGMARTHRGRGRKPIAPVEAVA